MVPIGLHKPLPFLVLRQLLRITSTLLPVASTRRVPQILVGTVTQYVVWLLAPSYAYGCNIPSSIGVLREASFNKNSFYLESDEIINSILISLLVFSIKYYPYLYTDKVIIIGVMFWK